MFFIDFIVKTLCPVILLNFALLFTNISSEDIIKIMMKDDNSIETLLLLDGERFVIDESLGLWVKFSVKLTDKSNRWHGIRYSLSLHNKNNERIMGFDNAHIIEYGGKVGVAPKKAYDHWHYDEQDKGRPYNYENAGKLLEDFWIEVDKRCKKLKEEKND